MSKPLIIVVEDEADIQDIVAYNLKREGYDVLTAGRGDQGLSLIQSKNPDLVILDIMLPGIDGLTICQQLRAEAKTKALPIIILSAKEEESDVVIGLGLGADDYMPKPFEPRELLARINSILRRVNEPSSLIDILEFEGLHIDKMKQINAILFFSSEKLKTFICVKLNTAIKIVKNNMIFSIFPILICCSVKLKK